MRLVIHLTACNRFIWNADDLIDRASLGDRVEVVGFQNWSTRILNKKPSAAIEIDNEMASASAAGLTGNARVGCRIIEANYVRKKEEFCSLARAPVPVRLQSTAMPCYH